MKKFFALLLALAMILALSACGEKQQEPSNEGDEQDNTPAQTFNFKVSITQASTDPLATYTQQWMDGRYLLPLRTIHRRRPCLWEYPRP